MKPQKQHDYITTLSLTTKLFLVHIL